MMKKNLPAFLWQMLLDQVLEEDFIKDLILKSCKALLVAIMSTCSWDATPRSLTMPKELKQDKELKAFEGAAWFKEEFRLLAKGSQHKSRIPPEALFNLDGESVKTIHDCHQESTTKKNSKDQQCTPSTKGGNDSEVDLTHKTGRDSASQSSLSSPKNNEASHNGLLSKTSSNNKECTGATGGR
jgi:hypothetical protein